jgi:SAM-dependent methyltransferase
VDQAAHNKIVSFIWGIADDVLRALFRRAEYSDVILPMCVIRRMNAVLEPTKKQVLVPYALCTIPDPAAALEEVRRVLKPGGKLVFCEYGLAPDPSVRRWRDRLTPLWAKLAGGCHLNRDVPALQAGAGFRPLIAEQAYLPGPRLLTCNYWGAAVVESEDEGAVAGPPGAR